MSDRCVHCDVADLNNRFGLALDRRHVEPWVELFTPDAVYANGRVVLRGHDELRAWVTRRSSVIGRTTRHVWSGLRLEPDGDDRLSAESIWVCYAANQDPPVDAVAVSSVADFVDTLRRVDGRWLIESREIRTVFRDPSVAPKV